MVLRGCWVAVLVAVPLFAQAASDQSQIQKHAMQAQADLQNKRPDLAAEEFRAIVALDPQNLDARANLGVLEYFNNHYADAATDLRSAVERKPDLWKLQALLGMSEKRLGDNAHAKTDLEQSFPHLEEKKFRVQAGLELIEVDYALGELGKAAEVANVLRDLDPTNPDIIYAAHRIYSDLSDETLLNLAMVAPNSARMHQIMAHELARQAKDEEAIAQYREALKLDPNRADIHYELAEILNTQSSKPLRDEAEKEYKIALSENPFDEKSTCRLGEIAMRHSDPHAAAEYYTRALRLEPSDPVANLGMAKVYMSLHQPQKAEPLLEAAVRAEPFDPASRYRLGVVYREIGKADDSRRELAEFEKLKKMKQELSEVYQRMRLAPAGSQMGDTDTVQ